MAFMFFAFVVNRPGLYHLAKTAGRLLQNLHPIVKGTHLDPARGWTRTRELPPIAKRTFKEFWRERKGA
jgi:hypothetical protein